jgi:hypothetical protein
VVDTAFSISRNRQFLQGGKLLPLYREWNQEISIPANRISMALAMFSLIFPGIPEVLSFEGIDATVATGMGSCPPDQFQNTGNTEIRWLWLILLLLVLLWLAFAVTAYVAWRKISRDLAYCWNQVGDEDHYLAQQAHRIDMLSSRYSDLNDRITETSNELSMTHDYVSGLHFSVVEGGGLLQHGLGLTNDQWVHLNTLERANMQAFHSMSSGTYMQLIRQRSRAIGPADATDSPNMDEHAESESRENDMEVDPNLHTVHYGQSVSEMYEALKCEQRLCISNGDNRDSSVIQNLLLMSYKQLRLV